MRYPMPFAHWLALRAEFIDVAGSTRTETRSYYLEGAVGGAVGIFHVTGPETNKSNVVAAALGPELSLPMGGGRIYATALSGVAGVHVSSAAVGNNGAVGFTVPAHSNPVNFVWGGGSGVVLPIVGGRLPLGLDCGIRYWDAGSAGYMGAPQPAPSNEYQVSFPTVHRRTTFLTPIVGVVAQF